MSTAVITLPVQSHRRPVVSTILIGTGLALVAWGRAVMRARATRTMHDRDAHELARARRAAILLRDVQPRYGFHS